MFGERRGVAGSDRDGCRASAAGERQALHGFARDARVADGDRHGARGQQAGDDELKMRIRFGVRAQADPEKPTGGVVRDRVR